MLENRNIGLAPYFMHQMQLMQTSQYYARHRPLIAYCIDRF